MKRKAKEVMEKAISFKDIKNFEKDFSNSRNLLAQNAVVANGINAVAKNHMAKVNNPYAFSVEVDAGKVTNQKQSGRCWMFASYNVMRLEVIKKLDLGHFELSQNYPLFFDKLEKSNYFLENIIDNIDEENVFICMYANMMGVPQAIPKVNRTEYSAVCQNCGIKAMVSAKEICAHEITRYVRAIQSSSGQSMLSVYNLMDGTVEALEFEVTDDVPHLGERLADLKTKSNTLLACITRKGKVIFPGGSDSLQKGDIVVVVTSRNRVIVELKDIFED